MPIKALAFGKSRLSPALSPAARQALSQAMLTDVLRNLRQASMVDGVVVVTSDASVLALAHQLGAFPVGEGYPRGLNGAVAVGTEFCLRRGATALLVLLADLPLVTSEDVDLLFRQMSGGPEVVLVPCKEGDGTNALLRVPPLVMAPCFGGPSLEAHQVAARNQGLACRVIEVPRLAFDLDSINDLEKFAAHPTATCSYQVLQQALQDLKKRSRAEPKT